MQVNNDKNKQLVLKQVKTALADLMPEKTAMQASHFCDVYFKRVPFKKMGRETPAMLAAMVAGQFEFLQQRKRGSLSIRVFNPEPGNDGWDCQHTIVEMVNDDMPFLVDTASMVLQELSLGVHLIETPGWAFPFQGDGEFEPRLQIIDQISSEFRPGDIALVSRIYLSRTHPHPQHDLEPWLQRVSVLADELAEQGMSTVVTGPPPIFHYKDIRECSLDDRETCRLERAEIAAHMDAVMERLNELATHNDNIVIFNIFESTCPSDTKYCYPDNGSSYLYKDRDHFNSLGAKLLAEPFVDLLRSSGALAPER